MHYGCALEIYLHTTKKKLQKLQNFLFSSRDQIHNYSEVALFCSGKVDQASLIIDELEINFVRRLNKNISLIRYIKLTYNIFLDYRYYFSKSALKRKTYLDYTVSISSFYLLSEALRSDYKSYGSVHNSSLGASLYKLHRSFLEFKNISLPNVKFCMWT